MTSSLEDEIQRIVASMENEDQTSQERDLPEATEQEIEPGETIHIHYFPDAIVILKEDADTAQVVDSVPITPQNISFMPAYAICSFYLFLLFSCIAFQVYALLNPPIATVTIIPKSQTVTLAGTLQLGRLLQPITISQSQTVPATGRGYQPPEQARGFITFYNGQFQSLTIAVGTILTGTDGTEIITDQDATIPAANPPIFGQTTVSAHTINAGSKGNIPAFDIKEACCAQSVLVKNINPFTGGQNERTFTTVTKSDVNTAATTLKSSLDISMQGALQGQVQPPEQLYMLPCAPTVTSDHPIGAEATQVKVTVSQTCSAVAYSREALEQNATDLLTRQAATKIGTGYSLFGEVNVTVTQTMTTHTPPVVFLSFHAQGTWIYGLSSKAQEHIKALIAGKTKQQALDILAHLPGIVQATIGDVDGNAKLPRNPTLIHLVILEQLG